MQEARQRSAGSAFLPHGRGASIVAPCSFSARDLTRLPGAVAIGGFLRVVKRRPRFAERRPLP